MRNDDLHAHTFGMACPVGDCTWPKPDEINPDVHNDADPGCDYCGTCMAHDGCADRDNPIDLVRGDCAECGACGDCVRDCTHQRTSDTRPNPSGGEFR